MSNHEQPFFMRDHWVYDPRAPRPARPSRQGLETLALHVFGHNPGARALYEKLGYEITNINMAKHLRTNEGD